MGSIHGRRQMYRTPNRCRQTSAGNHAMRLPLRRCDAGVPGVSDTAPIAHRNLMIMHPQRFLRLGYRARSCASVRAEVYSDSNRPAQNDPSCQTPIARHVSLVQLGLAQQRLYIVTERRAYGSVFGTGCAAIVFG
jgi:hypothetical protein